MRPKAPSLFIPGSFRMSLNDVDAPPPSSGIQLIDFTGPVFETDAADLILDVPFPTGIQANDVLLAHLVSDWADGWTTDGGFTFLNNQDSNPTHAVRHQLWGKVAAGTESGNLACTFNSGLVSVMGGAMTLWRGVDVSGGIGTFGASDGVRDGVAATTQRSENSPSATATGPSITTNTDGAVVLFYEANDGAQNSGSGPATEIYFADTLLGNDMGMALSYIVKDPAGASGTKTFNLDAADDWVCLTTTLKPAA